MVQYSEPQATIRPVVAVHKEQQQPQAKKPEATVNKQLTALLRIKSMQ